MNKLALSSILILGAAVGCGEDNAGSPDAAVSSLCQTYCETITTNCSGDNAQYDSTDDCLSYCGEVGWPDGDTTAMDGNSLSCRIYHGGAPAAGNPALHCSHAGPDGDGVCGRVDFRTDMPGVFARVDGMGMPAVATALVGSARKTAYNDATPDSSGFASDFVGTLMAIHAALDDDLIGLQLAPCSMTGTPSCVSQEYAPGASVGSLVLPSDSLVVNPAQPAGFPNGRALADPVIDVVLAVLLLNLSGGTCGGAPCTAATLAGVPLNPAANDVAFPTEFPYVAPAHQP